MIVLIIILLIIHYFYKYNIEYYKKETICCFGASVTKQKTGYVYYLNDLLKDKYNIIQFGYGSMHLNDAGIIFIDDVLKHHPNYCIIDWFSTGYTSINNNTNKYIDTIIRKFTKNRCILIFLFLPRNDTPNRIKYYNFCKKRLDKYNILYIDLSNRFDINHVLRDSVHTNDNGSKLYAKEIYNIFINKNMKLIKKIPLKNKYYNIQKIIFNKTIYNYIILHGKCKIIGFNLIIGRYSGKIKILNKNKDIINVWDKWCYYERQNIKLQFNISKKVKLKVLQSDFDRSLSKKKINWSEYKNKLVINEIYYIGKLKIGKYQ